MADPKKQGSLALVGGENALAIHDDSEHACLCQDKTSQSSDHLPALGRAVQDHHDIRTWVRCEAGSVRCRQHRRRIDHDRLAFDLRSTEQLAHCWRSSDVAGKRERRACGKETQSAKRAEFVHSFPEVELVTENVDESRLARNAEDLVQSRISQVCVDEQNGPVYESRDERVVRSDGRCPIAEAWARENERA